MNTSDASPDPSGLEPRLEPRLERCRRVLDAMSDAGMRLLEALDPDDDAMSVRDLALAYSRISRTLRLTIILDMRLDALASGGLAALVAEQALAGAASETKDDAETEADPAEPSDRREDTRVRLDREAPDEALRYLKRPMVELVAAICRGFELSPEETEQAKAPFAALVANNDDAPDDPAHTAGAPRAPSASRAAGEASVLRRSALGP